MATDESLTVVLRQEAAPAGQWVVELQRVGGRLSIYRGTKEAKNWALAVAQELAEFLDVPLVLRLRPVGESGVPSGGLP